jgi:hypothetical protein
VKVAVLAIGMSLALATTAVAKGLHQRVSGQISKGGSVVVRSDTMDRNKLDAWATTPQVVLIGGRHKRRAPMPGSGSKAMTPLPQ